MPSLGSSLSHDQGLDLVTHPWARSAALLLLLIAGIRWETRRSAVRQGIDSSQGPINIELWQNLP